MKGCIRSLLKSPVKLVKMLRIGGLCLRDYGMSEAEEGAEIPEMNTENEEELPGPMPTEEGETVIVEELVVSLLNDVEAARVWRSSIACEDSFTYAHAIASLFKKTDPYQHLEGVAILFTSVTRMRIESIVACIREQAKNAEEKPTVCEAGIRRIGSKIQLLRAKLYAPEEACHPQSLAKQEVDCSNTRGDRVASIKSNYEGHPQGLSTEKPQSDNPIAPRGQTIAQLKEQIAEAERFTPKRERIETGWNMTSLICSVGDELGPSFGNREHCYGSSD